jgi:hypothetical protein
MWMGQSASPDGNVCGPVFSCTATSSQYIIHEAHVLYSGAQASQTYVFDIPTKVLSGHLEVHPGTTSESKSTCTVAPDPAAPKPEPRP